MTLFVNVCSGTRPGGERPQMMHPHGEKVEGRMLIVMTAVSLTSAASAATTAVTTAVRSLSETVEMTVKPEVHPEVRRKVSKTCQKSISGVTLSTYKSQMYLQHCYEKLCKTPFKLESAGGAMCLCHRKPGIDGKKTLHNRCSSSLTYQFVPT